MAGKLKVGVIGVGGIARRHFPGWHMSPHTELVAMGDPDTSVLAEWGGREEVTRLYEDPYAMIAEPDIDIVDICAPNAYHLPLTLAALEAGKHVLCEKPLALTPAEVREMIAARDKAGTLLMTAQHFRFDPRAIALKSEVDRGALGEVYHARAWMLRRFLLPARDGFVHKKHSGGGPCIDIGVHILDLTLWMMGHPRPVAVSGVTQRQLAVQPGAFSEWGGAIPKTMDVEEFAAAFVRFETGAALILEVSWMLHHKTEDEDMQMWLYGTKGGGHWPDNEILSTNNKARTYLSRTVTKRGGEEPHAAECMAFAEAVAKGKPSPVPPEQSLDMIAILDGLYRSAEKGKEIVL